MSASLDSTFGAAFIGVVVAAVLLGVSCIQAYHYFTNQNDSLYTKLSVTAVMILNILHQAVITHSVYTYTITDWGNTEQLQIVTWSSVIEVIFTGTTAFIVQSFLTLRIWRLSGQNILLTGTSAILVVGCFGSAIAYTAKGLQLKSITSITSLSKIRGECISVNVLGAAADLLIAATLCTILNFSRTGFHRSDDIINRLIIFSVNTGLLTSLCALASLISLFAASNTFIYASFFFCLGRLYTNSLLAILNARNILRAVSNETRTAKMLVSFREFPHDPIVEPQNISIKIDTTTQAYPGSDQDLISKFSACRGNL